MIPETQEKLIGKKRSVGDNAVVEKKKPFLESQPISSFGSTQATPLSPAVVSRKTAVTYLSGRLRKIKASKKFREDRGFLNGICKFSESGRLSGLGPLE